MFTRSARLYDAIYHWKDYAAESGKIHERIQATKRTSGSRLLDVACGTGAHMVHLRAHYHVVGVDIEPDLLDVAREKLPDAPFYQGHMIDFDVNQTFDAVICLFSAIGYVKTVDNLRAAVASMARHVLPGGVLIIEPSFERETFTPGYLGAVFVNQPGLKIARMNLSTVEGDLAVLNFRYMVGTPDGITTFDERHELAMFEREVYRGAYEAAGLVDVAFDEDGVDGRGLWLGVKTA